MDKEKITVIIILTIFCIGMTMGFAAAGHTYKKSKWSATVSDNQYSKIQHIKKNGLNSEELASSKLPNFKVKTKQKYSYKNPVYKNKKVTKYKWQTKTVKAWDDNYEFVDNDTVRVEHYEYRIPSKYNDWKFVKEYSKSSDQKESGYYVFKKKVKYTTTKKVKSGYETVKVPVYAKFGTSKTVHPGNNTTYDYHPWIQFTAKTNIKTVYLTGKEPI